MRQVDALIRRHNHRKVVFIKPPVRVAFQRQQSLFLFLEQKTSLECDLPLVQSLVRAVESAKTL
jgi:hypothetical protein